MHQTKYGSEYYRSGTQTCVIPGPTKPVSDMFIPISLVYHERYTIMW